MLWFVWKEKGRDRRRWRRLRVLLPLLGTRWNWAADALKVIRKESFGMWAAGVPGGHTLNLSIPAVPFFSRQRVVNPPGDEAWSCGNNLASPG